MVEHLLRLRSRFSIPRGFSGAAVLQKGCNLHSWQSKKALEPALALPRGHTQSAKQGERYRYGGAFAPKQMGQRLSLKVSSPTDGSVLRAQDRDAAVERNVVGTSPSGLWLIVGLGNPGPKFAGNRHNVGFMAVDQIAKKEGVRIDKKLSRASVARCKFGGHSILLAKPLTYMNLSGEAVSGLAKFYKVPTDKILIIYDDLDTPLGSVKLKAKGGHGGHNGIRSLGANLKGNFPRIKIGVGRPPGSRSVIDHVLQDFTKQEKLEVDLAIDEALHLLESVLRMGMERALSGMRC